MSLVIADASEGSCPGESSLLQKQQHRATRSLIPSEAAPASYSSIPDEVLEKLIVSTPWNCDLLPFAADPRAPTCGLSFRETGLHPGNLSKLGNSSHDHMNSMRMLFPIGALPCCSTMPFCGAPACSVSGAVAATPTQTCTKHTPNDNFAYMSSVEMWPAYHGWGGSFEIDVMKHVDVLGTLLRQDGRAEPFDLVIDIGANSGFITEKLTTRHFAKNYILVDAFKGLLDMFQTRLGNETFKQRWFAEQVPQRLGAEVPNLEFLNVAVSNVSGGTLDLCVKDDGMWSTSNNGTACPVSKMALDDAIPARLSPATQSAFAAAQNAYVKVDVEGYDQMALEGMAGILQEGRGTYDNGVPRHLVNFIQLELCQSCSEHVKAVEHRADYDVKTLTTFLESMGFETFLMGPRYIPLSHGSFDDKFRDFFRNAANSNDKKYRAFHNMYCPGYQCGAKANSFTADLFAVRANHPRAAEIKLALGSCQESKDFSLSDAQYELPLVKAAAA